MFDALTTYCFRSSFSQAKASNLPFDFCKPLLNKSERLNLSNFSNYPTLSPGKMLSLQNLETFFKFYLFFRADGFVPKATTAST